MKYLAKTSIPGLLVIITGSTASGKDTIAKELLKKFPNFSKIITTTTRPPRIGEINGQDYYFVLKETFFEMRRLGKLLEEVKYSGNYYGTTKEEVKKVLLGKNMIWRIEPTMAARAKKYLAKITNHLIVIFITTPDKETLFRRLHTRGMSKEIIQVRFKQDGENWHNLKDKFEHIVVNSDGKLEETISEISKLINAVSPNI